MRMTLVVLVCVMAAACAGTKGTPFVGGGDRAGGPPVCAVVLEVINGAIGDPGKVTCKRGSFLNVVVIDTDSNTQYTVSIDPTKITYNHAPKNPLREQQPGSATAASDQAGVILFHVLGNAEYGTYKYTITWSGSKSGTLDPDIEIAN